MSREGIREADGHNFVRSDEAKAALQPGGSEPKPEAVRAQEAEAKYPSTKPKAIDASRSQAKDSKTRRRGNNENHNHNDLYHHDDNPKGDIGPNKVSTIAELIPHLRWGPLEALSLRKLLT